MERQSDRYAGLGWADHEEIRQLYHRFALLHDLRRDQEVFDTLFDFDERDDGGFLYDVSSLGITGPKATTRAQFEEWFARENLTMAQVVHMNLNILVEGTGDGRARGSSVMLFRGLQRSGLCIEGTVLSEDTFVHLPQGWRFRTRVMRPIGPPPAVTTSTENPWERVGDGFAAARDELGRRPS